jgi:ppGpp synthetase/RelA/SpoT-type nucleotidyltranferase
VVIQVDGRPVELQLRTERQTRWADFAHDTVYKTHGTPPPPEAHPYLQGMSDFYACLDGGGDHQSCGTPPECPPVIEQAYGCLEVT